VLESQSTKEIRL